MAERQGNSKAWVKANEQTTVRFSKSLLEVGELIKMELLPLYTVGLLSSETALERSGYNYASELDRKKREQPSDELFQPRSSFAQTTVNPDTPEKKAESTSTGRPADTGEAGKSEGYEDGLEASVPTWDETKKELYSRRSTPSSVNSSTKGKRRKSLSAS